MKFHGRLQVLVTVAAVYALVIAVFYFLKIPLRSDNLHSHYDVSNERIAKAMLSVQNNIKKVVKIGNVQIEASEGSESDEKLLIETFHKADSDQNGEMTVLELTTWISQRIKGHLTTALRENFFIFTAVDVDPRNGAVSWLEYTSYFLKQHSYDEEFIQAHKADLKTLPRELKEFIMRDKAMWAEAVRDNPNELSIDEFLAFRHPESSHATIIALVEEVIARLDSDGDGFLNKEEFSEPANNEIPKHLSEEEFRLLREKDFIDVVDRNHDGKASRQEMVMYTDPRHIHHASKEASNLLAIGDSNHDGVLSLAEVLAESTIFLSSKMVDVGRSFHDEF